MSRVPRLLLWGSTLLTALTGLVYAWMKHLLEPVNEWAVINHPFQPWVLKLHILVAPVMVFAVGMGTMSHIWPLMRSGLPRGRLTGVWTAAAFGPLVFTGYVIQAVTIPALLAALGWAHLGLGVLVTSAFLGHRVAVSRRIRQPRGSLRVLKVAATAAVSRGG